MAVQKFPHEQAASDGQLLNQSHTSKSMFLVSLMNPKFANPIAAKCVQASGSGY